MNRHNQNGACTNYDSNGWDGTCLNCGMPWRTTTSTADPQASSYRRAMLPSTASTSTAYYPVRYV